MIFLGDELSSGIDQESTIRGRWDVLIKRAKEIKILMERKKVAQGNGVITAYIECGEGKPLVFIHGFTGDKREYTHHMEVMGKRYHCYCYDIVGHGESEINLSQMDPWCMREQLRSFLTALDLKDVALVGHSMGGMIIMSYIGEYGCDRLRATMLADTTPNKNNDETWHLGPIGATASGSASGLQLMKDDFRMWCLHFYRNIGFGRQLTGDAYREAFEAWYGRMDGPALTRIQEINQVDYRDTLAKWTVPAAYCYAVPGVLFSPEMADYYACRLTQVPYRRYPITNCHSHMFPLERPEDYLAQITDFLAFVDAL